MLRNRTVIEILARIARAVERIADSLDVRKEADRLAAELDKKNKELQAAIDAANKEQPNA